MRKGRGLETPRTAASERLAAILALWGIGSVPFFKVEGLGVGGVRRGKATPGYEESRG